MTADAPTNGQATEKHEEEPKTAIELYSERNRPVTQVPNGQSAHSISQQRIVG